MDVRITGWNADKLAEEACQSIFGDDISGGPARRAPPVLQQIKGDWPAHPDDPTRIALALPSDTSEAMRQAELVKDHGHTVVLAHLVTVLANGRKVGTAIRMDADSLVALAGWEAAWAAYLKKLRAGIGR